MGYYPIWSYHIQNYECLPAYLHDVKQKVILTNNINGKGLRILLSHSYSKHDISLKDMSVKINSRFYHLTINNQDHITLHPNESLYTDTINLDIHAKDEIEITLVINCKGPICGYIGLNSNENIQVEYSQSLDCGVLKKGFNQYVYFGIEAIEIKTNKKPFVIGVIGDSLVHQGYWMNSLYKIINQRYENVVMYNEGISGNRLLRDASSTSSLHSIFGKSGMNRFQEDIYKRYKPDIVIFALGLNDLVHPGNGCQLEELPTVEEMIMGYKKIYSQNIYICTLSPFYNYDMIWNEEREIIRLQVNNWIRQQRFLDIDKWVRKKQDKKRLNQLYDSGDHLHFNQIAGQKIADEMIKIIKGEWNHG